MIVKCLDRWIDLNKLEIVFHLNRIGIEVFCFDIQVGGHISEFKEYRADLIKDAHSFLLEKWIGLNSGRILIPEKDNK